MTFFHGTNDFGLNETKKQKYLLHKRINYCSVTYLTNDLNIARKYGNIILKVEYNPFKNIKENNYCDGCDQFRVYEPIYNWKILEINNCCIIGEK